MTVEEAHEATTTAGNAGAGDGDAANGATSVDAGALLTALLAERELARTALAEITDLKSIGKEAGHEEHEAGVVTLYFESLLAGYPGWRWAATLAKVGNDEPVTVLEVELLPGEDAVLAPEWVPWSERLAQYREAQVRQAEEDAAEAAAAELADLDEVDAEDDILDNDHTEHDSDMHGADVDDDESDDDDSDDADDSDDEESDDEDSDSDSDDDDDDDDDADSDDEDDELDD